LPVNFIRRNLRSIARNFFRILIKAANNTPLEEMQIGSGIIIPELQSPDDLSFTLLMQRVERIERLLGINFAQEVTYVRNGGSGGGERSGDNRTSG
jgi:hypothetical protein